MNVKIKGNKLTVDMNEQEEDIFFRHGLQLMVDQCKGKGKFKVVPYDKEIKANKTIDFKDEDIEECVKMAILDAIETYIERCKSQEHQKAQKAEKDETPISETSVMCDHANEVPHVCKCGGNCYCKKHTCKTNKTEKKKDKK